MSPSAPNAQARYRYLLPQLQRRGIDLATATAKDMGTAAYLLAQTAPAGTPLQTIARAVAANPRAMWQWVRRHPDELRSAAGADADAAARYMAIPAGLFTLTTHDDAMVTARDLTHSTGRPWLVAEIAP